jgi:hypothetical protein
MYQRCKCFKIKGQKPIANFQAGGGAQRASKPILQTV